MSIFSKLENWPLKIAPVVLSALYAAYRHLAGISDEQQEFSGGIHLMLAELLILIGGFYLTFCAVKDTLNGKRKQATIQAILCLLTWFCFATTKNIPL
ncbi:MAG TPA: hypothetical protein DIW20_03145 [Rhodospirillaceae bacterium]|nr:hypothetical protein [Rhodospirillaceae bacterium]